LAAATLAVSHAQNLLKTQKDTQPVKKQAGVLDI